MSFPRLFIDKLALTIPIAEGERQGVLDRLDERERWHDDLVGPARSAGRYQYKYVYTAPNGHAVLIFASPRRAANFLKLEYSPNNISESGRDALSALLQAVIGSGYREAFYAGAVNRIHVAFEKTRIPLSDLWVSDSKPRKSAIIRGDDGKTETVYLPFGATRQLCVYDKRQQLIDTGARVSSTPYPPAIVRFEHRNDKADYSLGELASRANTNPFERYSVRQYRLIPELGDSASRLLFDALRLQGASQLLAKLDGAEREVYRRAIGEFPIPEFWRRRISIWGQFRACINDLLV